jgi:hypothetical protein
MKKGAYKLLLTLLVVMLFMGFHCVQDDTSSFPYDFIEKVSLSPAQKNYHVGDTLWIQYVNTDNKLFDNKTSQKILADSMSLDFLVALSALYNTVINPRDGFCDYVTPAGIKAQRQSGVTGNSLYLDPGCTTANNYSFKLGVVFKEKGIFTLDLGSDRLVTPCVNRVQRFPQSPIGFRFDVADGNKDVYLSIPLASRGGKSASRFAERNIDEKKSFALKVE